MSWDLHAAAVRGDVAAAKRAIENGDLVNRCDEIGWTPLHCAAAIGNADVAKFLLDNGADIDQRDSNQGFTPLIQAALSSHASVVELLLERGASVHKRDNLGRGALFAAIQVRDKNSIALLEKAGARLSEGEQATIDDKRQKAKQIIVLVVIGVVALICIVALRMMGIL